MKLYDAHDQPNYYSQSIENIKVIKFIEGLECGGGIAKEVGSGGSVYVEGMNFEVYLSLSLLPEITHFGGSPWILSNWELL